MHLSFSTGYFFRIEWNMTEILIFCVLFFANHEKKKGFPLRIAFGILLAFGYYALSSVFYASSEGTPFYPWVKAFVYVSGSVASVTVFIAAYRDSLPERISCALSALAAHCVVSNLRLVLFPGFELFRGILTDYLYLRLLLYQLYNYAVVLPFTLLIWFFFARKSPRLTEGTKYGVFLILFSVALLMTSVLSGFIPFYSTEETAQLSVICELFAALCGFLVLFIKRELVTRILAVNELAIVESLHAMEQKQYEQLKRNMNTINVKCHDMKRFLRDLDGRIDAEELEGMKKTLRSFDGVFHTNLEALDVILNERNFYCMENSIRFTCLGDASPLSFMRAGDVYSLFGNALDNAIEAVLSVDEAEKRFINLVIEHAPHRVIVDIMNYYAGTVSFRGGMPETKKGDKVHHGFGVMSMRMTAEKYGGALYVSAKDGVFRVRAIFPLER